MLFLQHRCRDKEYAPDAMGIVTVQISPIAAIGEEVLTGTHGNLFITKPLLDMFLTKIGSIFANIDVEQNNILCYNKR